MGDVGMAADVAREALWIAIKIALPVLAVGLVVGLIVSVLQAATQIQEGSIAFVPKLVAIVVTLILLLPWMLGTLVEYARRMVTDLPGLGL